MTPPETAAAASSSSSSSASPPGAALRVFVVEDHADTLHTLRRLLNRLGHTVFEARDMGEALRTLPGTECDVLLSDIGLPDGDGWELLKKAAPLLSRPLYAVAMSGYGENADCEKSRAAGYRCHLVKPVQIHALKALLAEAVGLLDRGRRSAAAGKALSCEVPAAERGA